MIRQSPTRRLYRSVPMIRFTAPDQGSAAIWARAALILSISAFGSLEMAFRNSLVVLTIHIAKGSSVVRELLSALVQNLEYLFERQVIACRDSGASPVKLGDLFRRQPILRIV